MLLVSGGDGAVLPGLVEETLDQVPVAIQEAAERGRLAPVGHRPDRGANDPSASLNPEPDSVATLRRDLDGDAGRLGHALAFIGAVRNNTTGEPEQFPWLEACVLASDLPLVLQNKEV
jgi:hypothetical protein